MIALPSAGHCVEGGVLIVTVSPSLLPSAVWPLYHLEQQKLFDQHSVLLQEELLCEYKYIFSVGEEVSIYLVWGRGVLTF